MLSCKEVARKIASDEFQGEGWRDRLAVRLHLLGCRHCRRYKAQLRSIGTAARNLWGLHSEDPPNLERLERRILEQSLGGPEDATETSKRQGGIDGLQ